MTMYAGCNRIAQDGVAKEKQRLSGDNSSAAVTSKRPVACAVRGSDESMTVSRIDGKFTPDDLGELQSELQAGGLDSWQAGELISAFLAARGYGVSTREARSAATRIELQSCSIECMQRELGQLALEM